MPMPQLLVYRPSLSTRDISKGKPSKHTYSLLEKFALTCVTVLVIFPADSSGHQWQSFGCVCFETLALSTQSRISQLLKCH